MASDIKLFNMDCMEALREMEDNQFDLAIVDPPYGIGEAGKRNVSGDRVNSHWKNPDPNRSVKYKTFDDSRPPDSEYFQQLERVCRNQIIWGGNYFADKLPPSKGWIVWDKKADIRERLSMCELAYSSFDKKCNKFEYLWAGFKKAEQVVRIHPTQKPVQLYKWLLNNYAKEGDKILDTHFGSLSIGVACWDLGFDLTAYELDEDYFKAGFQRLETHKEQGQFNFA